jgi:hypothetical protein
MYLNVGALKRIEAEEGISREEWAVWGWSRDRYCVKLFKEVAG